MPNSGLEDPFLARTVVVIPALNEAASVAATVLAWRSLGAARVRVIDNHSTDSTATNAAAAGAEVIHEPVRGYGAAAWRGVQSLPPDCRWVLFSSADGSDRLSPADLALWQQATDSGAELIIGDRTAHRASRGHLKAAQRFGNWICVTAIAIGWGRRFRDMGSLRLVHHTALDRMQLQDRSFGWNIEMQVRALELGITIQEIPVGYHPRLAGESKISGSVAGTVRAAQSMLTTLLYLFRLRLQQGRRTRTSSESPPIVASMVGPEGFEPPTKRL